MGSIGTPGWENLNRPPLRWCRDHRSCHWFRSSAVASPCQTNRAPHHFPLAQRLPFGLRTHREQHPTLSPGGTLRPCHDSPGPGHRGTGRLVRAKVAGREGRGGDLGLRRGVVPPGRGRQGGQSGRRRRRRTRSPGQSDRAETGPPPRQRSPRPPGPHHADCDHPAGSRKARSRRAPPSQAQPAAPQPPKPPPPRSPCDRPATAQWALSTPSKNGPLQGRALARPKRSDIVT